MTETTGSTATPESGNPEGAEGAADETTSTEDGKKSRRERRRANKAAGGEGGKKSGKRAKKGLFARIAIFYRQIIAELRKVVWPTRSQLIQYTTVVVVFVIVMMLVVAGLDWVFAKGAFWIFG
ncbi:MULTISPECIES: preprotein translocase subunit SecE [Kitasatospora]|uniref:Protein translocase subunit SecE n=1 Tax=Kitasatospora setae (strain ATCC 33774 / DSM 43861 / JCM 3304 / KCC A-0304 / NBRC 14216 / KM-6054) TaxID=452652 RepID=E4NCT6_KITSK|nr:preprotein translocase subunit SecE [Kitasatospora setae]BAJ29017.1 putative preprotein translocase SecE subunit [Kitasatospora setae KM-6054]